jgi:hypothetical protein
MTSTTPRTVSTFLTRPASLVVLMGGLLLSACGGTAPVVDPAPTPNPAPTPDPTPNPAPAFTAVKISFRPAAGSSTANANPTALPAGFTANTGTAYDTAKADTTGNSGWIDSSAATTTPVDLAINTRDRGTSPATGAAAEQNTFILMQVPAANTGNKTPGAFKYDLPNGTYTVTASVGDAGTATDSTNVINVNGSSLITAFVPTATKKFATGTLDVTVANKTLIFDAKGSTNPKLNYITITLK